MTLERVVLTLLLVGFAVWLLFTASGYAKRHAQLTEEWAVGSTRLVEITVVRDDRARLACASDADVGGLHCGYHANFVEREPRDEGVTLQPLNTVNNELFLGAGLWLAQGLARTTAHGRFTIVCNYHVDGVVRSAALRWSAGGRFTPLDKSVTAGRLTECAVPR